MTDDQSPRGVVPPEIDLDVVDPEGQGLGESHVSPAPSAG